MVERYAGRMRVKVLFFGVLRDRFGGREDWVDLSAEPQTVGGLLRHLHNRLATQDAGAGFEELWPSLAVAVNQQYAHHAQQLHAEDEVALLPPVSGGADSTQDRVVLTHAVIGGDAAVAGLKAGMDGAVVVFDGIVRNNTRGRETQYLLYEAYDAMALTQMQALVADALERFPVRDALLHHRLGRLEIGETSVYIAVSSAHRGAAFEACRWIIDTLKKTVPIWKKEFFVDGAVWADGEPFPEALQPGMPQ